jgi:HAMP domain-containing protein
MFFIFFSIAMIPLAAISVAAIGYTRGALAPLSRLSLPGAGAILVASVLILASLVALAASRLSRPLRQLVGTVSLFVEGSWEQRADLQDNNEIGELAFRFNQLADELNNFQHTLLDHENDQNNSRRAAPVLMAQLAATAKNLDELLGGAVEIFIKHFGCSTSAVYLVERKDPVGVTFAVLAKSASNLEGDTPVIAQRLRQERVNLDTTPTMNWLAGQAIASHRPQVRATEDDTGIIEAALPIIQNTPENGGRVLGVLDLFAVSRVKDSRLGPFSIRTVSEMQSIVGILALGLANLVRSSGSVGTPAIGKRSSFLPDLETVLTTSRRITQAETSEQILEAVKDVLRSSPFSSAVLLRPDEAALDLFSSKAPLRVVECRSHRGHLLGSQPAADTLVSPQLETVERFFTNWQSEMLLISDVNQAVINLDRRPQEQDVPSFIAGLEDSEPPRELLMIARWLGCRTAAYLPAVRAGQLLMVLLIGSTADMPPLTTKAELLEPYLDLLNMAADGLERIRSARDVQRQLLELETFWQVSQAISFGANTTTDSTAETDIEALYALIHRQVERAMGKFTSFVIVLYDAATNLVSIPYMVEEGEHLHAAPFELGPGFSSEVIRTRRSLLMFNQDEIDAKTLELQAKQVGEAPKSWLGVPMLVSGQVIGLIIVQDVKEEFRFNAQDERLLSMLATQVAVVVRNIHLLEATRRQARLERLVNEISDHIRRQVDVETILKTTTDELGRALGVRQATLRINPQVIGVEAGSAGTPPESNHSPQPEAPGMPVGEFQL